MSKMKAILSTKRLAVLLFSFTIVLSGCGKDGGNGAATKEADVVKAIEIKEPVTVKVAVAPNYIPEALFQQIVIEPAKKKYPNITIEVLPFAPNLKSLQTMIAQGNLPDLLVTSSNIMDPMRTVGFATNIEPYLKAVQMDMSRFEEGSLNAVKTSSGGEYLAAVPYTRNFSVLYYNKDIFDRFGVVYPKDGMTWDDTIELAKKLTRQDGGVQYKGLHPDLVYRSATQLGMGYIDPKTLKANINTDKWKRVFETQQRIFAIPGNTYTPGGQAPVLFAKERTVAMLASINRLDAIAEAGDLNWDMASYPTYQEAPGKGINYDLHVMAITANSTNKEAAALVLSVITSDESQKLIEQSGRISVLKDASIHKLFGQNLPFLKNKNVDAIFKVTPAANFAPTEFDGLATGVLNDKISIAVFKDNLDVNSALRQAEEEINKLIDQSKK